MRDVDHALARLYRDTPPAPPASSPTPANPPGARPSHPGAGRDARPPAPHFPMDLDARGAPADEADRPVALHWPETVLALERAHGDRFDALALRLAEARDRQLLKTFLFTSCHRAEGRTTLVLTLARALARRPGRTLLVDGDLGGPMLARLLGLRVRVGLDDVVESRLPAAEALIEAPGDRLTVLPLRGPVVRPREFLAAPARALVLARLRREFDQVLIDGGPLFNGLGAAIPHPSVDAAVLVYNAALTGPRGLARAREVLESSGIPLLGLAETFV